MIVISNDDGGVSQLSLERNPCRSDFHRDAFASHIFVQGISHPIIRRTG